MDDEGKESRDIEKGKQRLEDILIKTFSLAIAPLFCLIAGPALCADNVRLDVKPGQWETTVSGQTTGMPPIPEEVLKKLTPEQRAKMEAAMQARGGAKTTVSKGCLTQQDLDKGFNPNNEGAKNCSRFVVTSSGSRQEIRVECLVGGAKTTGLIKVDAADSEHVKGSMQMTAVSGDHTMNMNYTFSSHYLGPVCSEK